MPWLCREYVQCKQENETGNSSVEFDKAAVQEMFNTIIVIRGLIEVTCERAGGLEIEQGPMLTSQDNNDNRDSTFRKFDIL